MFQEAIKNAQQYTLPVVVSYRRQDGSTGSSIGAFIVLNEDGWILTAWHIVGQMQKFAQELSSYNDYMGKIAREGLNNPHLGRNAIGCGSKIRFEDLSER